MILKKISAENPNFEKMDEMLTAMRSLLDDPANSALTLEELSEYQDEDGSFKLFDSYKVPNDARVDYCHMPTYMGAAIMMRELLSGRTDMRGALEQALKASMLRKLRGHGYEAEEERVAAISLFIRGGLRDFLQTKREICPEFHQMIHNIIHYYDKAIKTKDTVRGWGIDYHAQWQGIIDNLSTDSKLYIAYGSNMSKNQMLTRCHSAICGGKAHIEDWQLTMPFFANIEPSKGSLTPGLLWEINASDERMLDRHEGYPSCYVKTNTIVVANGLRLSAMAYVMTDTHKQSGRTASKAYVECIIQGYRDAGFSESEFNPL